MNKDWLDKLTQAALERVKSDYYKYDQGARGSHNSFTDAIGNSSSNSIIAELKPASPSEGSLFEATNLTVDDWVKLFAESGATGISVLTEPRYFKGSLANLAKAAKSGLPILMKDFLVDPIQLEAAKKAGADAVLFIQALFERGLTNFSLDEGIKYAHRLGLEVLLEVASTKEYERALKTEADMIGINNRDLKTLQVNLATTIHILEHMGKDRIVWSLSGISDFSDIRYLESVEVDAFLVGTSLMKSNHPGTKLTELREV